MAKRTKKTHPERAVLKGSGGEYVVTKVQMLFETTKLLAKKFRKKLREGDTIVKRRAISEHDILPTKGMRLEGSLEGSTQAIKNHQLHARINLFSRKKYQSLIFRCKIRLISFIHRALSRMRLL